MKSLDEMIFLGAGAGPSFFQVLSLKCPWNTLRHNSTFWWTISLINPFLNGSFKDDKNFGLITFSATLSPISKTVALSSMTMAFLNCTLMPQIPVINSMLKWYLCFKWKLIRNKILSWKFCLAFAVFLDLILGTGFQFPQTTQLSQLTYTGLTSPLTITAYAAIILSIMLE